MQWSNLSIVECKSQADSRLKPTQNKAEEHEVQTCLDWDQHHRSFKNRGYPQSSKIGQDGPLIPGHSLSVLCSHFKLLLDVGAYGHVSVFSSQSKARFCVYPLQPKSWSSKEFCISNRAYVTMKEMTLIIICTIWGKGRNSTSYNIEMQTQMPEHQSSCPIVASSVYSLNLCTFSVQSSGHLDVIFPANRISFIA